MSSDSWRPMPSFVGWAPLSRLLRPFWCPWRPRSTVSVEVGPFFVDCLAFQFEHREFVLQEQGWNAFEDLRRSGIAQARGHEALELACLAYQRGVSGSEVAT